MQGSTAILFGTFKTIPPEMEAEWNRWYDTHHSNSRLALPGFVAARRFRSYEGECQYLSLYEMESTAAVSTPEYMALRDSELPLPADSMTMRSRNLPGFVRGVYQQIFPQKPYVMPDSKVLFVVAHDIPDGREDEFSAWYNTEHIPAMLRLPGFLTARRFKLAHPPAAGDARQPMYVSLYDLANEDAVENEQFMRDRESPWSSWVRSWYTRRLRIKAREITRLAAPRR